MIAILLCAGFGTRMYPLTKDFPKPLLEIGGRPTIDYLIDQILEFQEMESIYIVTNDAFFSHFLRWAQKRKSNINERGIALHIYNDGATDNANRLGAIRDLAFLVNSLKSSKHTIVAGGDNIFLFSLNPLWESFLKNNRNYVLALKEHKREELKKTGVLQMDSDNRVLQLHEKPQNPPSNLMCPALYFLQPSALLRINEYLDQTGVKEDAPGNFISYLLEKEPVYAFLVEGKRLDIGTPENYENAKMVLEKKSDILPKEK